MNEIQYTIINLTEENIQKLEELRYDAYGLDKSKLPIATSFYTKNLQAGKYLVFGCLYHNQLIGACYVSNAHNSLYIEQLFISKQHQKTSLHLGTNLLLHILKNKQQVEEYFQTELNYSYLDSKPNAVNFYKNLGYQEKNYLMRKRI